MSEISLREYGPCKREGERAFSGQASYVENQLVLYLSPSGWIVGASMTGFFDYQMGCEGGILSYMKTYSDELKAGIIAKMQPPNIASISELSRETAPKARYTHGA